MFRHNVGGIDRVLRMTLGGIFFLGGLFLLTSTVRLGVILAVVGLLALLTGIVRFCALYIPFGISTGRPKQPLTQVCDCAAWMKAMQDNHTAAAPPASAEAEEVAGVDDPAADGRDAPGLRRVSCVSMADEPPVVITVTDSRRLPGVE